RAREPRRHVESALAGFAVKLRIEMPPVVAGTSLLGGAAAWLRVAEGAEMKVVDTLAREPRRKVLLSEAVLARPGDRPHVDERYGAGFLERCDKIGERRALIADGKD